MLTSESEERVTVQLTSEERTEVLAALEDDVDAVLATVEAIVARRVREALTEAADEVHIETNYQYEMRVQVSRRSSQRAQLVHGYAFERFTGVEQILRERASLVGINPREGE